MTRLRTIRLLLLFEAASFITAALIHFGLLIHGYPHWKAGTAESVIAVVLLAGLVMTWIRPGAAREIGLAAHAFALLGTLVGIFTIAIGVGPRTPLDIAFHVGIVAMLVYGLALVSRARLSGPAQQA